MQLTMVYTQGSKVPGPLGVPNLIWRHFQIKVKFEMMVFEESVKLQ